MRPPAADVGRIDWPEPDAAPALDLAGDYLLAVALHTAPDPPVLFLARVETPPGRPRVMERFTVTPLTAADRAPLPEHQQAVLGVPVDPDGAFTIDLGAVLLPAAANPLIESDAETTLTLTGHATPDGVLCGDVEGEVTRPIQVDLAGTTFGAVRVQDPGGLAGVEPVVSCER